MGLQLQQKDQNHTAISHRCQARKQVGEKAQSSPNFGLQILNWSKNFHDRVKPTIPSTKLHIPGPFPMFLR